MQALRRCYFHILMPIAACILTFFSPLSHCAAQTTAAPAQGQPPQPQASAFPVNDDNIKAALMLVRSTLLALDHANATGNYTVFHAMTAPFLRNRFNPSDYSDYYAAMRQAKIILTPAVVAPVKFARAPYLNENGLLTLEGAIQTAPSPTTFRLQMSKVADRWLIVAFDLNDYSKAVPGASSSVAPQTKSDKTSVTSAGNGQQLASQADRGTDPQVTVREKGKGPRAKSKAAPAGE